MLSLDKSFLQSAEESFTSQSHAHSSHITTDQQWVRVCGYKQSNVAENFGFNPISTSVYFLLLLAAIEGEI